MYQELHLGQHGYDKSRTTYTNWTQLVLVTVSGTSSGTTLIQKIWGQYILGTTQIRQIWDKTGKMNQGYHTSETTSGTTCISQIND